MFEFVDAEPIPAAPSGGGRVAEPNPYTDVIASIALKVDKKGKPLAKAFILSHGEDADSAGKAVRKVRRQLSDAGDNNTPRVTVPTRDKPYTDSKTGELVPGKTLITFWTVARQERPRKPKTEVTDVAV